MLRPLLIVIACAALVRAEPRAIESGVVLEWNETTLQAVRNARFAPMWTARALAIVHTAVFDAWAAYDGRAIGTHFGGSLRRPADERVRSKKAKAISYAAYRALVDLFPLQVPLFDERMRALRFDPSDNSLDLSTPQGIGNQCARTIIESRHHDGSNQLGGYADYTGYLPINSSSQLNDPNRWQPLATTAGDQVFVAPHWRYVTPFALASAGEFRPGPPPMYPNRRYRREASRILSLSTRLTDRQKMIATYWADGPSTETPPGHWNLFAAYVSRRDGHSLDQDVKMFFALNNALLDASIAVWDAKVHYDYIRPVSAIRFLNRGRPDENWHSYIPTPPFAEYVSGHSAFSAASAEILRSFTGSDAFGASVKFARGSSPIEPGVVPARSVRLRWATFSDAADQAGRSRRYGGIHFESGDLQARALGRKVGAKAWRRAKAHFQTR